jgi:hypothetical protein
MIILSPYKCGHAEEGRKSIFVHSGEYEILQDIAAVPFGSLEARMRSDDTS